MFVISFPQDQDTDHEIVGPFDTFEQAQDWLTNLYAPISIESGQIVKVRIPDSIMVGLSHLVSSKTKS